MKKIESLKDRIALKIASKEIEHFKKLIRGHEKILEAIGKL